MHVTCMDWCLNFMHVSCMFHACSMHEKYAYFMHETCIFQVYSKHDTGVFRAWYRHSLCMIQVYSKQVTGVFHVWYWGIPFKCVPCTVQLQAY